MEPSTLPPTYVRFINRMGGKDNYVWAAIRVRNDAFAWLQLQMAKQALGEERAKQGPAYACARGQRHV